jgi:hypothetical protein
MHFMRCNDLVEKELPILGVWWTHQLHIGFQYVLAVNCVLVDYLRILYNIFCKVVESSYDKETILSPYY